MWRAFFVVSAALAGCGCGESVTNTIDRFVPADVIEHYGEFTDRQIQCIRNAYLLDGRMAECSRDEGALQSRWEALAVARPGDHCESIDRDVPALPADAERCFDTWATAPCSELAGPPTPDACFIVQRWDDSDNSDACRADNPDGWCAEGRCVVRGASATCE